MAEVQDRRLVRERARQPQPYEPSHRLDLVEHVLHTRITKVVEHLHAVNPQHHRQLIGSPAPACPGIERADAFYELFPRDQTVHALKEYLPPGLALLALVFQVGKCWLGSIVSSPQTSLLCVWHITMPQHTRLVQSIPRPVIPKRMRWRQSQRGLRHRRSLVCIPFRDFLPVAKQAAARKQQCHSQRQYECGCSHHCHPYCVNPKLPTPSLPFPRCYHH